MRVLREELQGEGQYHAEIVIFLGILNLPGDKYSV
jgi:hypothetical protein